MPFRSDVGNAQRTEDGWMASGCVYYVLRKGIGMRSKDRNITQEREKGFLLVLACPPLTRYVPLYTVHTAGLRTVVKE